jgi:NADH dehydrogenase/NADH:ubiquinone oxidoreductase subunit G
MNRDQLRDIFEPYEKLVTIKVCGKKHEVPENNTILRGLQYLNVEAISYGEFCWNGECLNCQVWLKNGEKEKAVMACRTNVSEGMDIIRVSDEVASGLEMLD